MATRLKPCEEEDVEMSYEKVHERLGLVLCLSILSWTASSAQWISQTVPSDISILLSIAFSSTQHGVAGGYSLRGEPRGRAIYTTDGGTTWDLAQVPDSSRSLVSVQMFGNGSGYIVGAYNSSVSRLRSTTALSAPYIDHSASSARARYCNRIGMSGVDEYKGLFLRTTNNGQSWSKWGMLPESTYYMHSISFVNPDSGCVTISTTHEVGRAGILKTTDGGASWVHGAVPDSVAILASIKFYNGMLGFAVGWRRVDSNISGVILRTIDGGMQWEQKNFPLVDNFTGVFVTSATTAYASGVTREGNAVLYKTTNAGLAWMPVPIDMNSTLLEGVCFASDATTGLVYGSTTSSPWVSYASRTTDGGGSWMRAALPGDSNDVLLTHGVLLDDATWYLVGGNLGGNSGEAGVVYHTTNGGVTFIPEADGQTPQQNMLLQNYPNPFNPSTTIRYGLPKRSYVTLTVFNTLGQQVAILQRGEQEAGNYEVKFDGNGLSGGVYFYTITAGNLTQMRKAVLVR
jgi:photosystem II stability/assembly factor-like uncharacterized protein